MAIPQEKIEEFHRNSGEVLRLALEVESKLDWFLYNYFCKSEGNSLLYFNDILLSKLGFEIKVQTFEELCNSEYLDAKLTKKVLKSIRFIKKARNTVAHGKLFFKSAKGEPHIYRGSWLTSKSINDIKLDSDFMMELNSKKENSVQGIDKLLKELFDRFKEVKTTIN